MKLSKNPITGSAVGVTPIFMCITRQANGVSSITWHKTEQELRKQQKLKGLEHESCTD